MLFPDLLWISAALVFFCTAWPLRKSTLEFLAALEERNEQKAVAFKQARFAPTWLRMPTF